MQDRPRVIILNGVGSVGKSSTAQALQQITAKPFLHVSMDSFIAMLPARVFGRPDGLIFETIEEGGKPSIVIKSGKIVERAMHGMRHAIAALAGQGNDLIVDEVMMGNGEGEEYCRLLSGFDFRMVGLFAPLEVLEARERERGDREIGLARWQHARVHRGLSYDLEIETSGTTPLENALRICAAFCLETLHPGTQATSSQAGCN